jgi:three-Cys-motif partner protein
LIVPVPTAVIWPLDPHTRVKHDILRRYLDAWYPIFMQTPWRSVTYAEGFAGSGVCEQGEEGSPVIAAGVFLRRRHFLDNGKELTMVLVEEDSRRLDQLRHEMQACVSRHGGTPRTMRIVYRHGECSARLLPALSETGARSGPIFAFLDSFGGPDVPLHIARAIGSVRSSEVFVTFGTSFLTRFGADEAHQQQGDEVFGSQAWRQVLALPPAEKKPFLVSTYRQSLISAGFRYVISFEMVDESGHDLHLVFGTSNPTGLQRMKDAMWNADPVQGMRFRDPRDPDQMTFGFDLHPNLGPLRRSLLAKLDQSDQTVAELQDYALLETVHRKPHALAATREILREGLAERDPPAGQLSGATRIKISARGRIRLAQQHPSLF